MVESKSVKVDNWGVFFLQKLQNFFNKTDYCDLTLQFMDNSQLKVHRLVLSACTDYFNVLEQQCEINDDTLVMPYDLQADVVVPIVNFMYTGTLEFEVTMYARLLKTAKDMNMTVLLKLLEAHKRTVNTAQPARSAPVLLNKGAQRQAVSIGSGVSRPGGPQRTLQHRRLPETSARIMMEGVSRSVVGRPMMSGKKNVPEAVRLVSKYGGGSSSSQVKGPSRFECAEEQVNPDQFETSFDDISYESRPLTTAGQVKEERRSGDASGSFEQLRKGYTGVKRPASSLGSESPPQKKPNIQDVKEYTEAHKLRKKIVAEEFNDEEDDESPEFVIKSDPDNPNETTLIGGKGGDNVDHAKIISEVLKKYPHLVKNNKNIKLKITQKGQQHTITAPLRSSSSSGPSSSSTPKASSLPIQKAITRPTVAERRIPAPSNVVPKTSPAAQPAVSKPNTVVNETVNPSGPKKIDSRTMHALIAKGAENVTGPWLCLKCGVNGRPISIPSYKGFRRHLINVHKLKIDPKLCEHCGWRSTTKEELHHHILVVHNINPPPDMKFPKCNECNFVGIDQKHMKTHKVEKHPTKVNRANAQHCIYCNKTFTDETRLYDHMRSNHRDRAREDGVMDTDDEDLEDEDEYLPNLQSIASVSDNNKIQVLSNITLPSKGVSYVLDSNSQAISSIGGSSSSESVTKLEPSSEAEGLNNVATGIATSLGMLDTEDTEHLEEEGASSQDESNISAYLEDEMASVHGEMLKGKVTEEEVVVDGVGTQFVSEEGSTLELTEAQKTELLQQLQDKQGVVMILNEDGFGATQTDEEVNLEKTDESVEEKEEEKPNEENMLFESDMGEVENEETHSNDVEKIVAKKSSKDDDDDEEDEEEEMEEDAEPEQSTSEKAEPASTAPAASAKSLIEGDWTDDDEEEEEAEEVQKPESPSPQYESNHPEESSPEIISMPSNRSYKGREGRSSNDSIKETVISQDSGIEEKPTKNTEDETHTAAASQLEREVEEEEIVLNIDVPQADEEELKKASKIEIKTLINDWGDDDDDENLD